MRFGVLTGGGDCPGLNAAIRAIVRPRSRRIGALGLQSRPVAGRETPERSSRYQGRNPGGTADDDGFVESGEAGVYEMDADSRDAAMRARSALLAKEKRAVEREHRSDQPEAECDRRDDGERSERSAPQRAERIDEKEQQRDDVVELFVVWFELLRNDLFDERTGRGGIIGESGIESSAETSATDLTSRHRWQIRWCSGSSPISWAGSAVVLTSASIASW